MEYGETAFPQYGTGNYVQDMGDQEGVLDFKDFSAGYLSAVAAEMVPANATPRSIDIEVTRNNRLKRSPGTTVLEIFETHTPEHFVVHGSLDFTAELLFFDAPYLGVKRLSDTEWANKSLSGDGFAWANFGGTFIFTDGHKVYARQVNDGTNLTEIPDAPVALAYASWAGRMWALAGVIDGNFEPLGVIWSAADSDYTDWTGLGAGFELLIDQISSGDRGVALVPMGLDFMAIFLRKSIWIARRTGLTDRPGDFQPRVPSKGAINSEVPQATQEGVIYVTDGGVELFDGNTSTHISYQIDAELLPLDYSNILKYTSSYNPSTNRYYLHCPDGTTWIYELDFKRWIRRSLDAIESVIWPLQELDAVVEGKNRVVFLGDHVDESISHRAIEVEDQASELYFGQSQTPQWDLKPTSQEASNFLLTSKQFNIEYEGVADIELWAPNNNGVYEALVIDSLISQSPMDVVEIYAAKTGRLASLQLRITRGDAEFVSLQVLYIKRGPRVALGEGGIPGNFPDRTSLQVFPQGHVAPWTGGAGGPQRPVLIPETPEELAPNRFRFVLSGEDTPDAPVDGWVWDFGDGTTATTRENTVDHTYTEVGSYDVVVTPYYDWYSFGRFRYTRLTVAEIPPPPDPMDFYGADGHTVGEPNDAFIMRQAEGESFAAIKAGVGNDLDSETQLEFETINVDNSLVNPFFDKALQINLKPWDSGDQWYVLRRSILSFDIYQQFDVDPTVGSIFVTMKQNGNDDFGTNRLVLVTYPRGNPTKAVEEADFQELNSVGGFPASDTKPLVSSLVAGNEIEFPLNLTGLQHIIDKMPVNGPVWFGLRLECDRLGISPGDSSIGECDVYVLSARAATQGERPRLHLEFD